MAKVEFRTDGGDFAEIWIDNALAVMLNADIHDIETGEKVARSMSKILGAEFVVDNHYDWNRQTGYLEKPID